MVKDEPKVFCQCGCGQEVPLSQCIVIHHEPHDVTEFVHAIHYLLVYGSAMLPLRLRIKVPYGRANQTHRP